MDIVCQSSDCQEINLRKTRFLSLKYHVFWDICLEYISWKVIYQTRCVWETPMPPSRSRLWNIAMYGNILSQANAHVKYESAVSKYSEVIGNVVVFVKVGQRFQQWGIHIRNPYLPPKNTLSSWNPSFMHIAQPQGPWSGLTLSPPNKLSSAKFLVCFNIQSASMLHMLSECQTAWIRVKSWVTRRLIRIQAVCIWHYSRVWRSKS